MVGHKAKSQNAKVKSAVSAYSEQSKLLNFDLNF